MEEQSQQQQETNSKTLTESIEDGAGSKEGNSGGGGEGSGIDGESLVKVSPEKSKPGSGRKSSKESTSGSGEKSAQQQESESKRAKKDNDSGNSADRVGSRSSGDPGPSSRTKDNHDSGRKEKEGFPSLFISHASINISGSNPDISDSERLKISCRESNVGGVAGNSGAVSKTDLDNNSGPQRVPVHRVCSDSRIGEGEGFHSSKLTFYTADGSFTNSLKALGLSVSNTGSRSGSVKSNKSKQKQEGTGESSQVSTQEKGTGNQNNNSGSSGGGKSIKTRNQAVNAGTNPKVAVGGKNGTAIETAGEIRSGGGGRGSGAGTSGYTSSNSKHGLDLLPTIEQSVSEHLKTEHPSTSEGDETLTEDVVDEDEEVLDEYDEPNENLECQLDFDAAVTELLLRPEAEDDSALCYKDSATWTAEDDMPSPLSDFSPVASPRRKKERNNICREFERESTPGAGHSGSASGHSHNSLLEQYHQYLLEQQQQQQQSKPSRQSNRGGSGSKSGGSGGSIGSHHHSHSQHHHNNPNSSIVGIHQGNLKSHSHSQSHHHQHHSHHQPPLPPPPPPHQQQTECFTVSSQLLSREAKLYENVPATQGELETLEILLASGGSGDSNYPPSGGSGSGGGASNTTASTSNTSGTSGQSHNHSHKNSSNHGNNLSKSNNSSGHHHHGHHHRSSHQQTHNQLQQQQSSHHHNNHHLFPQGYVHGQHSHSANNLNATNPANSSEQLFSVSDFLGVGGGLSVGGNNNGGPPSRTSWADSGRESLSFDGENNNSTGSTRNLLLIPPPPPPPINYLASTSAATAHTTFGTNVGSSSGSMMHPTHHSQHHGGGNRHSSGHHSHHHSSRDHHHHHAHPQMSSESPSHTSHQTHRDTRRSRRERLVRQKHAINDETLFPPHGSDKALAGMVDAGASFMAAPSPRRGILPGSMQASNFVAAAASPINLQRHPPASQIMLQENKKNGPLIACESPYGIMAGGSGTVGNGDWAYPETFGDNFRRPTNKSHLTGNILRTRSPQRGRGIGIGGGSKGNNNSSFDYGELPSHQMFPKRHLLTSRQFSGHRGYPSAAGGGTMQNGAGGGGLCPPSGYQPMQHRSFPAGVFSGNTPRSCSMGDLTSSAASLNAPNGQGHHHPNHHGGKSPERMAISSNTAPVNGMQSSTVPLVTSLPLPPATSVTYEFSLAPVSGTLAPGWHLTAVQRGLATAVPLAAAVARRRLPRPRTARPRFGFTDKNEARRAKWTIVITALALLAMSMLLVGITLRLAPLIDDLGSSSSGSVKKRIAYRDSLSRRASGDPVPALDATSVAYRALSHPLKSKSRVNRHCVGDCDSSGEISIENGNEFHRKGCRVYFGQNFDSNSAQSSAAGSRQNLSSSFSSPLDPAERKQGGLLVHHGGSYKSQSSSHDGDGDRTMKRQISMTLSIPSREDSLRSCSSSKSLHSFATNAIQAGSVSPVPCTSRCITNAISTTGQILAATSKVAGGQGKPAMGKLTRYGSNPDVSSARLAKWRQGEQETLGLYQQQSNRSGGKLASSNRSLVVGSNCNIESLFPGSGRVSKANSYTNLEDKKKQILSQKQKRNEKVAWAVHLGFTILLILSITCIVVFLRLSSTMTSPATLSSSSYDPHSPISPDDFSTFNQSSPLIDDDDDDNNNSTSPGVRKENENLLQSIQPQLNLHNITTPQPSTQPQQVYDNSNGNDDSGQSGDRSKSSLQTGQSLTLPKGEIILPSSSFSESSSSSGQGEDEEGQRTSNNDTNYDNVNIMSSARKRDETDTEARGGSIDRSNNDSSKIATSSSNSNNNPSVKTNSIRPKRSKSRPKLVDGGGGGNMSPEINSSKIISVLNEKVHTSVINETPPSPNKARHLESTIFRFLKNSSSTDARERRNLEQESRKL